MKLVDEDNWFDIDENTGNLITQKQLDRESKFVKNDQYNVTIAAMDSGKCYFSGNKIKCTI